jgi:hypothetical protein
MVVFMKWILLTLVFSSCANLTPFGAKVGIIETEGSGFEVMDFADKISSKHSCQFVGYVDAKAALLPGSYSLHDNEIHTALRNRAAAIGANVVVANFYEKPARGVGLLCPETFVKGE